MIYRNRELRRIWNVEIYDGDPNDKKPKLRKETVVALNHVDAIRKAGGELASMPVATDWVTWDDPPMIIKDPKKGPTEKEAQPSIVVVEQE